MVGSAVPRTRGSSVIALWFALALLFGCGVPPATTQGDAGVAAEASPPPQATARVELGDLTAIQSHDGQLGYGSALPVVAGRAGTVTALPALGSVVTLGQPLAEVNGIPMRLLHGERPAWRPLAVSEWAADDGPDVHQLNHNLAAMGYAPREELPDARFDWRTREAVRRWQRDLGRPATGQLELGDVAFLPGDVRVSASEVTLGMWVQAGAVLLTVTDTTQIVTLALPVRDRDTVSEGQPVTIVLPDQTMVEGTVRTIAGVASVVEEGTDPTVAVEVSLAHAVAGAEGLDAAPVQVQVRRVLASGVLTVPVGALLATAGGGYAVERVVDGDTGLVAVEPGEFADGVVQVDGALQEGDRVVVPS